MGQSETIGKLSAALVAFQGEVCGVGKGGKNPHLRNTYARLEDVILATQEARLTHGLAVNQYPCEAPDGYVAVRTRLRHSSGEYEEDTFRMPIASGKGTTPAQQAGSALSYARRYAYLAVLGLASVDDDAEATRRRPDRPEQRKGPGPAKTEPTELQIAGANLDKVSSAEELSTWKSIYGDMRPEDKMHLVKAFGKKLEEFGTPKSKAGAA